MRKKTPKLITVALQDYDPIRKQDQPIRIQGIQKDGPIVERAAQYALMVEKKGLWNILYKELVEMEQNGSVTQLQLSYNIFALEWMCYFTYADKEILLMHPVMGAPAVECLVQQAHTIGCDTFVRIGTTGVLSEEIPLYSVISTLAAIRNDETSDHYLPIGFPAMATPALVEAMTSAMKKKGLEVREGISYTTATRFRENIDELFKLHKELGVMNIEMESASLFATAHSLEMRSASISLATDCLADEKSSGQVEGTLKGVPQYDSYFSTGVPNMLKMFHATLEVIQQDSNKHPRYLDIQSDIIHARKG